MNETERFTEIIKRLDTLIELVKAIIDENEENRGSG